MGEAKNVSVCHKVRLGYILGPGKSADYMCPESSIPRQLSACILHSRAEAQLAQPLISKS